MRPTHAPTRRLVGVLVVALSSALACAAPASTPAPAPTPVQRAPDARDPLEAPWSIAHQAGSFTNTLRLSSELVSRVDSVERTDSSHTLVVVSWSRLAGAEAPRVSGLVTAYAAGGAAEALAPIPGLLLPVPFSAADAQGAGQARLDAAASAACSPAAAVLQPLRELFVSAPPRLTPGTSWSDSASYAICRDSIPLAVRSSRTFRVVGAERRGELVVVLVDRTSQVTVRGEGTQFGEPLAITAEGSGSMRLAMSRDSGTIVEARGDTELRMTMRGRRRSQDLRQRTRIEISSP
ncbi:MAG: hypothetical protein K8S21_08205 [Gemmatimonadetes bacterium]|nr:hypothetical protein [Gemmatimonadota bacterium]